MDVNLLQGKVEGLTMEMMAEETAKFGLLAEMRETTILDEKNDSDERLWLILAGWRDHLAGLGLKRLNETMRMPEKGADPGCR